jgi:hypothetical protein
MQVYRIAIGTASRFVRASSRDEAKHIASLAWYRAAQRIGAIVAIGNRAPASLGAEGYDSAANSEAADIIAYRRKQKRQQRKAYNAQQKAYASQAPQVDIAQVFAAL